MYPEIKPELREIAGNNRSGFYAYSNVISDLARKNELIEYSHVYLAGFPVEDL